MQRLAAIDQDPAPLAGATFGRLVFSDLVPAEFRGRKPQTEFPLSLDVLEQAVRRRGYTAIDYAFLPGQPEQDALKAAGQPLPTLGVRGQTPQPVRTAQVWAINVMNYLQAPALFALLDLAGVPAERQRRTARDPLIVLGGHIWPNPLPLESFYDVLVAGDGEEVLPEILRLQAAWPDDRDRQRQALAGLSHVYVPGLTTRPVQRATIDFAQTAYAAGSSYIHDGAAAVLLSRGCAFTCAFCTSSLAGGPYRCKPMEQLIAQVDRLQAAGATTIIPVAASTAPYQSGGKTFSDLVRYIYQRGLRVKNLSDRPERMTPEELRLITRETGKVILAPESSPRLRGPVFRKSITEAALDRAIQAVITAAVPRIQFYVILATPPISPGVVAHLPGGFEGEQLEDLQYLARRAVAAAEQMLQARRMPPAGKPLVLLDCMPFIPALGTPLQRAAFPAYDTYSEHLHQLQALIPAQYAGVIEVAPALDVVTHELQMFLERAPAAAGHALWQIWQSTDTRPLGRLQLHAAMALAGVNPDQLTAEYRDRPLPYAGLTEVYDGRTRRTTG